LSSHNPRTSNPLLEKNMKAISKAVLLTAVALGLSATGASAEIVCNEIGDCWHVREHVDYKPEFRLRVHPDDWRWAESDHYRWREHEGRGCAKASGLTSGEWEPPFEGGFFL
jgi:hypothetical protein